MTAALVRGPCGIPSLTVGACDLDWGHVGDQHCNAGDEFYARNHADEHKRRQCELAKHDPIYRVRAHCHLRIVECRKIEQKFALDLSARERGQRRASTAPMAQTLIEAWTERMTLERIVLLLVPDLALDDVRDPVSE